MLGIGQYFFSRAEFNDLTKIHHRHAIAHVTDHRDVMRNQHKRQIALALQFDQQIEDLRLYGNIQGGGRFIEHDDIRLGRKRAGDGNALTLAAGKFVRQAVEILCADADLPGQRGG